MTINPEFSDKMIQIAALYHLDPAQVVIINHGSIDTIDTNLKIRSKKCIPQYKVSAKGYIDPNVTLQLILQSNKYVDVGHDGDDMVFMMRGKYQEESESYDIYFKPGTTMVGQNSIEYEVYLASDSGDLTIPWTFHFKLHSKVKKITMTDQQLLGLLNGESQVFKNSNHDRTTKEIYPQEFHQQIIKLTEFGQIRNLGSMNEISNRYPEDDTGYSLYILDKPGRKYESVLFRPVNDTEVIIYDLWYLGAETIVKRDVVIWAQLQAQCI